MSADTSVGSVRRALAILEIVSEQGTAGVSEIAGRLDVHKSTASRLVATLAADEYLERDPASRRLRLGAAALRLSGSTSNLPNLVHLARPILERLAAETGATVNLVARSGEKAVHLDQVDDARAMATINWIGRDTPLHCTSDGKVLLAFAPDDVVAAVFSQRFVRYTANTITDPARLRAELDDVRRSGIGRSLGELEEGLNGVSAAVRRADGSVIGCVCVSGPSFVVRPKTFPRFEKACIAAADAVSKRLGAPATSAATSRSAG